MLKRSIWRLVILWSPCIFMILEYWTCGHHRFQQAYDNKCFKVFPVFEGTLLIKEISTNLNLKKYWTSLFWAWYLEVIMRKILLVILITLDAPLYAGSITYDCHASGTDRLFIFMQSLVFDESPIESLNQNSLLGTPFEPGWCPAKARWKASCRDLRERTEIGLWRRTQSWWARSRSG